MKYRENKATCWQKYIQHSHSHTLDSYHVYMNCSSKVSFLWNSTSATCLCLFSQTSELLKALAERKSPPIDLRNISTTLSTLKNTRTGTSNTHGTFRSRAVLPENIRQLSNCQFKRRDHLRESLPASVPVPAPITTAVVSSQEQQLQPRLPSSNPVILALLVEKSKMLPSVSVCSIGKQLKEHEMHPHILGVQAWTKQQSCEPQRTLPVPEQSHQTG